MAEPSPATVIGSGRFLRLLDRESWEFVDRPGPTGVALVTALTEDHRLVLVEQYRAAVERPVIELPGGLIGDDQHAGEAAICAARRELLEETGYRADRWTELTRAATVPGSSTEMAMLFLAERLEKVALGGGDDDERLTVHRIPLDQTASWLDHQSALGKIIDLRVYAGLFFATRDRRGR